MSQKNRQLIKILEKFPDQNPNPVLRFSDKGVLMYYNDSSKNVYSEPINDILTKYIKVVPL